MRDAIERHYPAFEFVYPLYEMAKLRRNALTPGHPDYTGLNTFWHQEKLASSADRWITTPNNDTLYSRAWVDLSLGPVRITIPPSDGRYFSLALMDTYTNNFRVLSQRDVGSRGANLFLVGPHWNQPLPAGESVLQAPGDDVLLFTRTLVANDDDLPRARAIQRGFVVAPLKQAAAHNPLATGSDFVSLVRETLHRNPPRSYEQSMLTALQAAGLLDKGPAPDWQSLLPGCLVRLRDSARQILGASEAWAYAHPKVGEFGTHYALRALTALVGLLALPPSEVVYLGTEVDVDYHPLLGDAIYRIEFPPGDIPADAFWSLTMYEKMPSGAKFLADNPLDRYSITDRSQRLRRENDGSAFIWASHERPPAEFEDNWLPAPRAPFRLSIRAYHAKPAMLAREFRLKPVRRVSAFGERA